MSRRLAAGGGCPDLPVGFGVQMAGIKRESVPLADSRVPAGLFLVDVIRNITRSVDLSEAEQRIREEVIEGPPRPVEVVGKLRVGSIAGQSKVLPGRDIGIADFSIVGRVLLMFHYQRELRHCADADDGLHCKIRLIFETARKVVG